MSSNHKRNPNDLTQPRFDAQRAGGVDGRDNFLERKVSHSPTVSKTSRNKVLTFPPLEKVCNWITEDYEQCLMQRVKSNCGYEKEEADQVIAQVLILEVIPGQTKSFQS